MINAKNRIIISIITVILVIIVILPLLRFKLPSGHDTFCYFPKLVEFNENIREGILIPRWAPDLSGGYGQPIFNFIPPLIYYLGEIFYLSGFGFVSSMNMVCVVIILLSFFGMYIYAGEFFGARGGVLAGIAYIYAPYFLLNIYVRHALSEFAAFAFYPLILWSFYRLSREPGIKYAVLSALSYAALVLCHNPMTLIFTPLLFIYILYLFAAGRNVRYLLYALGSFELGILLTAYFWMPALIESEYTKVDLLVKGYAHYSNHFVYLRQLLFSKWGYGLSYEGLGDGLSFSIGIIHILLACGSILLLYRLISEKGNDRGGAVKGHLVFFMAAAAAAVFFTNGSSKFIWDRVGLLQPMAFPWRFLSLITLAVSFLCGAAINLIREEKRKSVLFYSAIGLILIFNIGHIGPEKYLAVDETRYTPEMIHANRIWTTTYGEYEPKWVKKRPDKPSVGKLELISGWVDVSILKSGIEEYKYDLRAKQRSVVRINTNYFPGWKVYLDGQEIEIYMNEYGLMDIDVPEGVHRLEARFENTPVRSFAEALSLSAFLTLSAVCAFGLYFSRKRIRGYFTGSYEKIYGFLSARSETRLKRIYAAAIILFIIIVFANTLNNKFYFDDYYLIIDNPGIHKIMPVWRHFLDPRTMSTLPRITQFRPLLPLTLSINYALAKDSLAGYHIGNIIFHIFASLFVFLAVMELQRHVRKGPVFDERSQSGFAFLTALIYAVHPVSGFPVNYISSRDLIMMNAFFLASFILYMRMRRIRGSGLGWIPVLAALLLSLLSKTNSVVAPLIILAFEAVIKGKSLKETSTWVRTLPFFGVVGFFFAYTKYVLKFSDIQQLAVINWSSCVNYAAVQAKLHLFNYLPNFFWPFPIHMTPIAQPIGIFNPKAVLGMIFIMLTLLAAWKTRKKYPMISFSILGYWIFMIPSSSVLPLYYLRQDYRPYPSSVFLYLVLLSLIFMFLKKGYRVLVVTFLVFYIAASSFFMNTIWRDEEKLWGYSVRKGGTSLSYLNLAMSTKNPYKRKEYLEEALRITPNYSLAHTNLGLLLIQMGDVQEGLEHIKKSVEINPGWAQIRYWASKAYELAGMRDLAVKESYQAAELDHYNVKYTYKAVLDAQYARDYEKSLVYISRIEKIQPRYMDTEFLKAYALQMTGRNAEAIQAYRRFLDYNPQHYQAQFNLGYALMEGKNFGEAIPFFLKTLDLKPDYREAHLHLASCYGKTGNSAASASHMEQYRKSGL
ncbi:MAG: tetratricopeptide repeat protein [Elusimicrobia bacterium]|nr:tetratricopeptide repeat protein [Elusimicrobiota bacterium]